MLPAHVAGKEREGRGHSKRSRFQCQDRCFSKLQDLRFQRLQDEQVGREGERGQESFYISRTQRIAHFQMLKCATAGYCKTLNFNNFKTGRELRGRAGKGHFNISIFTDLLI